jgi:hypothetical protein
MQLYRKGVEWRRGRSWRSWFTLMSQKVTSPSMQRHSSRPEVPVREPDRFICDRYSVTDRTPGGDGFAGCGVPGKPDIGEDLPRLRYPVAGADQIAAAVLGDLPGNEHQLAAFRDDDMAEGLRRGDPFRVNAFN